MVGILNHIISFFLIGFIIFSKFSMLDNPVKINSETDFDDYIIEIKSEKVSTQRNNIELTIRKDINEIKYKEKDIFLCPSFFLCKDEDDALNIFYLWKITIIKLILTKKAMK